MLSRELSFCNVVDDLLQGQGREADDEEHHLELSLCRRSCPPTCRSIIKSGSFSVSPSNSLGKRDGVLLMPEMSATAT